MPCFWPWLANYSLLWKRSHHLLLVPSPTEITLIWSHKVARAISRDRSTVQPDDSRLHFECIIHNLNFHSFLPHTNTKKQGILSPKMPKKSSLDRFHSVLIQKMFLLISLNSLHFSAPSCSKRKVYLLRFPPPDFSPFPFLWIFWYSGWIYCCSFLLRDSSRKAKDFSFISFHL